MAHAKELGCDCIIFDNELSPAQQRAWEEESGLCVIDRQEVILDIFNLRARTREARLQVAMARMEYSMPRLTRMWAHLDRQRGAGGTGGGGDGAARGMGESQFEVDRRLADEAPRQAEGGSSGSEQAARHPAQGAQQGARATWRHRRLHQRRQVLPAQHAHARATCWRRTSSSPRSTPARAAWNCPTASRCC